MLSRRGRRRFDASWLPVAVLAAATALCLWISAQPPTMVPSAPWDGGAIALPGEVRTGGSRPLAPGAGRGAYPAQPGSVTLEPALRSDSSATPEPAALGITDEEARDVIRRFFSAVDQDDFGAAAGLAHGSAREQVLGMTEAVRREAESRGVAADLRITGLVIPPTERRMEGRLARADFDFLAFARLGDWQLPVVFSRCSALFLVEKVDDEPRITAVISVDGLPGG